MKTKTITLIQYSKVFALMFAATFSLASCATAPPNLSNTPPERFTVAAKKVIIADFTQEQKHGAMETINSIRFTPLPNDATVPPFSDLVIRNLKTQFTATGGDGTDTLEIAILNTKLFMEIHMVDYCIFINIASAFSERKYMCRVDANFRYADKSVRKTFEVVDVKPRYWADLPTSDKASMVGKCVDQIVGEAHKFAVELVKN